MNEHHNIIISMIKDITDTIITTFYHYCFG